jgi:pimeloyl-ACP methyl ester carboxylesterase
MQHKTIYCLSGLGADERVFAGLNFKQNIVVHIAWVQPLRTDSLEDYAVRLASQITEPIPILVGVSFGGMLAIEIAKHIAVEKLILLSTAKLHTELPLYYRWAGRLGVHRLLPTAALKHANVFSYWLFGIHSTEHKALLKSILQDTDSYFLRWAISAIAHWQNTALPNNYIHLHGSADKIIPLRFVRPTHVIDDGGHLMVVANGVAVSDVVEGCL